MIFFNIHNGCNYLSVLGFKLIQMIFFNIHNGCNYLSVLGFKLIQMIFFNIHNGCNYLPVLGFKLILISKMGWWYRPIDFNSLWPSGTIWHRRYLSMLLQVMACCLTAPSHCLKQCWLPILWHSFQGNVYLKYSRYQSPCCVWNLHLWNHSNISHATIS